MIKKFLVILCLFFMSFPAFAFEQGDFLISGNAGGGLTFGKGEDIAGKNIMAGFTGKIGISAEVFPLSWLSLKVGSGFSIRESITALNAVTTIPYSVQKTEITIDDSFLIIPAELRLHTTNSDNYDFYIGFGYEYRKNLSSKCEIKNSDTGAVLYDDTLKKLNESAALLTLGLIIPGGDNLYIDINLQSAFVDSEKILLPGAMLIEKSNYELSLNGAIVSKF